MPAVLILCAHRPQRSPSQRYRFEQYLTLLGQHGYSFTFSYLLSEKDDQVFYAPGKIPKKVYILFKSFLKRLRDCFRFKKFDIIFIQREAAFLGHSIFEKQAKRSGKYVVFDFDDSIWLADTSPGNKKWEWLKKPGKFFNNIRHAHCVIAGNPYLAEKARPFNRNTVVIPTTIDTLIHFPKPGLRNAQVVTIGWSGSISTIKHFELLMPVLLQLKNKYKNRIRFSVLGPEKYVNKSLDIVSVKWRSDTEVDELNRFNIGIMPLPDDEWSRGKCGLKGLSYMACGIPTVMSPVGVNTEIIKHDKNGMLAGNESEWLSCLEKLINDAELRKSLGDAGRETVIEKYSVTNNIAHYLKVFEARFI